MKTLLTPAIQADSWLADYQARFTASVTDSELIEIRALSKDEIDKLKSKIKWADPAKIFLPANKSGYICPFCLNGTGSTGDGIKPTAASDGYVYHCFKSSDCEGDLLNIIADINALDLQKDFFAVLVIGKKILETAYNGKLENIDILPAESKPADVDTRTLAAIQADIFKPPFGADSIPADERRGLTLDTLKFVQVSWQKNWIHPKLRFGDNPPLPARRIIIPTSPESYVAVMPRSERTSDNKKFWKMDAGSKQVYHIIDKNKSTLPAELILVTEGEMDAMSVFQATEHKYLTAATGGTDSKKLVDFLNRKKPYLADNCLIVILFDADSAGRDGAKKALNTLTAAGFKAVDYLIDDTLDANAYLQKHGDDDLKSRIEEIISDAQSKFQPTPVDEYDFQDFFQNHFDAEIDKFKKYADRKTGFPNLDEVQKFLPGIYLLGALPGAGKTTFCWQMANQLADNGETVIYLTNEMSPLELFVKSVARELYQRDKSTALTATDIKLGAYSPILDAIKNDFKSTPKSLKVLDVRSKNIDDILKSLEHYCTGDTCKAPIFFVDYLQIISALDSKQSEYDKLNDIAKKLKDFQKQTNTTFIIISSFNRANYYTDTAMDAFKGSGNLEYTADGLLKLAVDIPTGATIADAMNLQPRNLKLTCLKNRNGNFYECKFDYFSAHDYFCPADSFNGNTSGRKSKDNGKKF